MTATRPSPHPVKLSYSPLLLTVSFGERWDKVLPELKLFIILISVVILVALEPSCTLVTNFLAQSSTDRSLSRVGDPRICFKNSAVCVANKQW